MHPLTGLLWNRLDDDLLGIGLFLMCVLLVVVGALLLARHGEQRAVPWVPEPHPAAGQAAEAGEALSPREARIDELERAFWAARRRGDVAGADQIEAELREMRAPLWC